MDTVSLIIPVFIAGIITFLAPCTLPILPGYLGFISGVSLQDIQNPLKKHLFKKKVFLNGVFFVLGFSLVFIVLGTFAGFLGHIFSTYRIWLNRVGGFFVVLFGLFMLNILEVSFLSNQKQLNMPSIFQKGKALNSFILGAAFGSGWTPCVGPILGTALTLAAVSSTALQGAFLMGVFSLGLAVPFLSIAASIGTASTKLAKISRFLYIVSEIGGIFLVILGILLFFDKLGILVTVFFRMFDLINYDSLLKYM